eukprot:528483-Hanusia_phi.AAC.3
MIIIFNLHLHLNLNLHASFLHFVPGLTGLQAASAYAHINATQQKREDFQNFEPVCKAILRRFVALPNVASADVRFRFFWAFLCALTSHSLHLLEALILSVDFQDLEPSYIIDLIWSLTQEQPVTKQIEHPLIANDAVCEATSKLSSANRPIFLSCNHTMKLQKRAAIAIQKTADALDMADVVDLFKRIPLIYCYLSGKGDDKLKDVLCLAFQTLCKKVFHYKDNSPKDSNRLHLFFIISYASIVLSACERVIIKLVSKELKLFTSGTPHSRLEFYKFAFDSAGYGVNGFGR